MEDIVYKEVGPFYKIDKNLQEEIKSVISENKLSIEFVEQLENGWIALENKTNTIIGFLGINSTPNQISHLQSMVVSKPYRKKGIGTQLINLAKEWVKETYPTNTLRAMTLFFNNPFYYSNGFVRQENPKELKQADEVGRREKHKYCVVLDWKPR